MGLCLRCGSSEHAKDECYLAPGGQRSQSQVNYERREVGNNNNVTQDNSNQQQREVNNSKSGALN